MENVPVFPMGILCELTHRCPLQCLYCSNPLQLERKQAEMSAEQWRDVFQQATKLGVLHAHLSGGEPALRQDLEQIVAYCREAGIYSNLITAGINIDAARLDRLQQAGLDHVQLSLQGADEKTSFRVCGMKNAIEKKLSFARAVNRRDIPLTINVVFHRQNIEQIPELLELAVNLNAERIEVAHTQYYGWALKNRAALMPSWEQTMIALNQVAELRERYYGKIVIDAVAPDYHARFPKPCMNGWGQRAINITPSGKVLPCHAAETIPHLEFWKVQDHSLEDIWYNSPAFNAYRGTDWMPDRCQNCERKEIDWAGCRCQALALTGNANESDPVCERSPWHSIISRIANVDSQDSPYVKLHYRRIGGDVAFTE